MDRSEEPAEQPTPEMTGENWIADGVPPARDARFTWYHELPAEALAREIFSRKNRGAALVTLKRPELHRGYFNGTVLMSEEEFADARRELLDLPGVSVLDGDEHEITLPRMADGRLYPAVVVAVANATAVAEIKSLPAFESIEPLFVAQDGVGCSLPPYVPNPADGEISDNRIPWTYRHLGIVQAWDLGHSVDRPGYPVRIGVVDTGVFQEEHQLIEIFGWDSKRSASHLTVVPKQWDDCGHGTRIAGLAAAPLDTQNIYPRKIGRAAAQRYRLVRPYRPYREGTADGDVGFPGAAAAGDPPVALAEEDVSLPGGQFEPFGLQIRKRRGWPTW